MTEEPQSQPHNAAMLRELSDIKASLAVNTVETANIKLTISEIKADLKIFQASFVTHEEFKSFVEADKDKEIRLRSLEKNVWKAIGALAILEIALPVVLYFLK